MAMSDWFKKAKTAADKKKEEAEAAKRAEEGQKNYQATKSASEKKAWEEVANE